MQSKSAVPLGNDVSENESVPDDKSLKLVNCFARDVFQNLQMVRRRTDAIVIICITLRRWLGGF
jgi:hypothetical protein